MKSFFLAPEVVSYQNYYAFGMLQAERTGNSEGYRYGYNGQEKSDEIAGEGNHTSALFWEYDTRLGRRWNLDPVPQISISDYSANRNNPILYNDPEGNVPQAVLGFIIGAGADYITQVGKNMASGRIFSESLTHDIDGWSILISGAAGALTSGASALGGNLSGKGAQFAITTAIDIGESVTKQATSGNGDITFSKTFSDVVSNKVAGSLTKKAENVIDTKPLTKDDDRTTRILKNDPTSSGRAKNVADAQKRLESANKVNKSSGQGAGSIVGNTVQNISDAVRTYFEDDIMRTNYRSYNAVGGATSVSDATSVKKPVILTPSKR